MIIERTTYRPKPGQFEAGARDPAARPAAAGVAIGLAGRHDLRGRHMPRASRPDVAWECAVPTPRRSSADLAAAAPTARPSRPSAHAHARLLARFERYVLRADDDRELRTAWRAAISAAIRSHRARCAFAAAARAERLSLSAAGTGAVPLPDHQPWQRHRPGHARDVCGRASPPLLMSWGIASFLPHRRGYGNSPGQALARGGDRPSSAPTTMTASSRRASIARATTCSRRWTWSRDAAGDRRRPYRRHGQLLRRRQSRCSPPPKPTASAAPWISPAPP